MPWTFSAPSGAPASASRFSASASSYLPRSLRLPSIISTTTTSKTTYLALAALFVPVALAHEHSMDSIPDDAATSPEPIVRFIVEGGERGDGCPEEAGKPASPHSIVGPLSTDYSLLTPAGPAGLDIMGTYLYQHDGLWRAVPHWDGTGREYSDSDPDPDPDPSADASDYVA